MDSVEFQRRLQAVEEGLLDIESKWNEHSLPPIENTYRMNESEWMHHVHQLAHTTILKEKLGLSDGEVELYMKEAFLAEVQRWLPICLEMRRNMIRAQIVAKGHPQI